MQGLALDVTLASWPIDLGRDFLGTYDLFADAPLLFERGLHDRVTEPVRCNGLDDPELARRLPKAALARFREGGCPEKTAREGLGEVCRSCVRLTRRPAGEPPRKACEARA